MTYYSDQVAASRRAVADALSGKRLRDSIRQLQERSRVTDGLKSLQARGALTSKKKIGKRVVSVDNGLASPFTETGSAERSTRIHYETVQSLESTDGLFVIQFSNIKTLNFLDSGNRELQFILQDVPPV